MKRTAILGAGLTGLSTAYHLGAGYEIFEQEPEVGGLCRTRKKNGFLFDYTGHLLHLRDEYTQHLVSELLPGQFRQHARNAAIYTQGRCLDYPFQANIHALPPEMIKECILGFVDTLQAPASLDLSDIMSFKEWVLKTFGAGIARQFMFPYNQKLWRIPLEQLSADWVSWSIPKPTLDEFLNGALGIANPAFGYNPTFLYPEQGGIEQLPLAFLPHIPHDALHLCTQATSIDAEHRIVYFNDSSSYQYDSLVSTVPLPHLATLLQNVPDEVARASKQLRYISVYDVNIGVARPDISDRHWMYFPDPDSLFYRVGFPANFSETVAPAGCSSMYVEVSMLPEEQMTEHQILEQVYDGLRRCGILRATDRILAEDVVRIECAYVIHDIHRPDALRAIGDYLDTHGILSAGRYGAWEYDSMEGAILAGKRIAAQLKSD